MEQTTLTVTATPPFSLQRSLDYIRAFYGRPYERVPAAEQIACKTVGDERVQGLRRVVSVRGQAVLFEVWPTAQPERLELTLYAKMLDDALTRAATDRVRFYLSLDDDLTPLYARCDPLFAEVVARLYGYHPVKVLTPFEAACWALVQQRTPNGFAHKTMARLAESFGPRLEHGGRRYVAFPEAQQLLDDPHARILAATNNTRKTERMLHLVRAFALADEAFLRAAPFDEVARWLGRIKGLGAWSVDFIALRGLGRYERVPWTDTGLLAAISKVYTKGLPISAGSAREIAERYGWYAGLWAHYVKTAAYGALAEGPP
ncbi:DNA-3-methyladenine glycosylase family protein [Truepera radiovictrix]|uniref:DNA-3-methyladenine glycosylase II n=1 Tax=Truepera radiovictrix (strain DSM 17093 / CIP 108686 / LMG 22925 / RQ-24) TaxID=649638 RepID=D7CX67_TRURR|nr:DNA-3-methyladenine glycosylase [Truepera radiovictrix]ADI13191.1 DNA-3-methyladenine glycosylase II [Truepera radiovictrix DSM 17093]WMT58240.1 DNA-3-methyladenine glycosylase [Truepera radiovictrix]